ncbi:hypothetical protein SLEP1_g25487 [Rubroshorea leprosula]|uniref:RRM domain-containing protein n=1 Tax=Rubroshorea leprosula TaxID=152421 RepID=A0AAV5JTJ0_9ROSI|nr:hypothetical protein SLEP1_g25487 [Rubroshorea leprosula]
MDPMTDEQINFGEDEYGGSQKMQYPRGGTIPALADEEPMGEDDEYDELYNDVNVGEGFLHMHHLEALSQPGGMANSGSEGQQAINKPEIGSVSYPSGSSISQKVGVMDMARDAQVKNLGFQGLVSAPSKIGVNPFDLPQKIANDTAQSLNSGAASPQGTPKIPTNQVGMNSNHSMVNENQIRPHVENGSTMLFVGELHWWTTNAELESACSQYGRVNKIKFYDERASGKSKGYCQIEFYDPGAAASCKKGMNSHVFNGRACVLAFASSQTLKQMGASYMNRTEGQSQSQSQGKRMNNGLGKGGNMNNQSGNAGRNYGRGAWGQGPGGKGGYRQGPTSNGFGVPPDGMMHPQGMMGAGFDPTYMGRGGYGAFPSPGFPGMLPPFPAVNAIGLAGVAPYVNLTFFGWGVAPNGMGMMGSSGMDGLHAGMWSDTSMGGWGGEEHDHQTRESSYGGEDGASEYGYEEGNHEKGRSSATSREKEQPSEHEWSKNTNRREEKEGYREHRQRDRDLDYEDDWDRGQSSSRSRSKSGVVPEEKHRCYIHLLAFSMISIHLEEECGLLRDTVSFTFVAMGLTGPLLAIILNLRDKL